MLQLFACGGYLFLLLVLLPKLQHPTTSRQGQLPLTFCTYFVLQSTTEVQATSKYYNQHRYYLHLPSLVVFVINGYVLFFFIGFCARSSPPPQSGDRLPQHRCCFEGAYRKQQRELGVVALLGSRCSCVVRK